MKRADKRPHLLAVATQLFNRFGYRAVGIDEVIAESGIAKTTLYRHFPSKEDLIVAVLQGIDEDYRNSMRSYVDAKTKPGDSKLVTTFDFLARWFGGDAFYGCPFISAAGEYEDRDSPVFHVAVMHKQLIVEYFEALARGEGFSHPQQIAEEINLLHEGAVAVAHITRNRKVAIKAKRAAIKLLAS